MHKPTDETTASLTERVDKLYEFEREPVSPDKLESAKHFAALFAGEHVAGTEFVIGAAFVAWGASAADVLIGLLIGNALAVLSWTLICAPIAVRTRLTLYWYLRKIAGPGVTAVYNVLNACLFCILSGTMITVSASAIRIPFGIAPQTKWYPEDFRFVLIVLVVGTVVVGVAILGFKRLAQFSEVCVPWLFVMFTAGARRHASGAGRRVAGNGNDWRRRGPVAHCSGTDLVAQSRQRPGHLAHHGLRLDLQPGLSCWIVGHGHAALRATSVLRAAFRLRDVPGTLPRLGLCGRDGGGGGLDLETALGGTGRRRGRVSGVGTGRHCWR